MSGRNIVSESIFLTRADITLFFEGIKLNLNMPICKNNNRYFIPLLSFTKYVGGRFYIKNDLICITLQNNKIICIDAKNSNCKYTILSNEFYISLFDICRILKMKSRWDYKNKQIWLYLDRDIHHDPKITLNKRIALIRFEDFTASNRYLESESLEKLRVVADYMYDRNAAFHIAWIPRYLDPLNNIDNDISLNFNMENAHFLFTLEYFINKNGIIGLHGYTHQYGDEVSGDGTEFSETNYTDEDSIRKRIEAAIKIASSLSLPYMFFESPHYASTAFQQSIYEFYFDIIYEGYVGIWGNNIVISPRNNKTLFIPTPLGFVEGENGLYEMISRINNINDSTLASLFYHPYAEFDYIKINSEKNEYPIYDYSNDSPLHLMIDGLYNKGCKYLKISDILKG